MSDLEAKREPNKEMGPTSPSTIPLTTTLQPSSLPSRYIRKQSVPILVGPKRETYLVYKDLLAAKSPFFAAQFEGCWDAMKSEIELLDADQEAFEVVIDWMYTDTLPKRLEPYCLQDHYPWITARRAYKLADQLMLPQLQNAIINSLLRIVRGTKLYWDVDEIEACAKEELLHTPYFRLIAKSYVRALMQYPKDPSKLSAELPALADQPQALIIVLETINNWNLDCFEDMYERGFCEYHVHDGPRCDEDVENFSNKCPCLYDDTTMHE